MTEDANQPEFHGHGFGRAGFPIVGIGASAGGLEALRDMLAPASGPTGMAFVIVQHLDPNHESMLAELLGRQTSLTVLQSAGGERVEPDTVYIIPPGHGLTIHDGMLELTDFAQPRGLRRPIDDFFASLAGDQQDNAACVILSGTGSDGTIGMRAVKEHGGVSMVQEPRTARYDGMPTSAVATGLVDFVRPPEKMLECLMQFFAGQAVRGAADGAPGLTLDDLDEMRRIMRQAVGHDFSGYKNSTLMRRVGRRMQVLGIDRGRAYLARLAEDESECAALLRDLLINVTRFFRDAEAFDTLLRLAIEPLLREQGAAQLRIWVPGCSSGEEAYTIAMLFAETARMQGKALNLRILATDIDARMLEIARTASYPSGALADIPREFCERYVIPFADRFSISPFIRDLVQFSDHSIVRDPPFSRVDMISCRNLLIYFDEGLQDRVLPLMHYAIRPGGYLFLGPSETIGRFDTLFAPVDQHARLFIRNPGEAAYPIDIPPRLARVDPAAFAAPADAARGGPGAAAAAGDSEAVRRLLGRYTPPSVIVDHDGGILAAYGKLGRYFEFPVTRSGGVSAINLARPGLRTVIGMLLRQARDSGERTVSRAVEVTSEYGRQVVDVFCEPLAGRTLLLVFRDSAPFVVDSDPDVVELSAEESHADSLEDELRVTRHRLRTTVEELETANEELKSSNEEMMSMNEELQSTNEELSTVNDELKGKIDELVQANSDLRNFFHSTELAVIVIDSDLRLRSYTKAARAILPLQPDDKGRMMADVAGVLAGDLHLDDARAVLIGGEAPQRRVTSRDGRRSYSLRTLPYRALDGSIEGATLVLADITTALGLERELADERGRLDMAVRAADIGVWEYREDSARVELDLAAGAMLGVEGAGEIAADRFMQLVHEDDRADISAQLRRALDDGGDIAATFRLCIRDDGTRWVKFFGRLVEGRSPRAVVGIAIDVTPEYALAETRNLMLREMNHRVKNLFAVVAGMISAAARTHDSVAGLAADLRDRIAGLGRAHSLSTMTPQADHMDLRALIQETLAPYDGDGRIAIDGPQVALGRSFLSPMALILHEWATNSVKYGALGTEHANLAISWERTGDELRLGWRESGGGEFRPDGSTGFGTLLVDLSVRQLGARLERSGRDGVFLLEMSVPERVFETQ